MSKTTKAAHAKAPSAPIELELVLDFGQNMGAHARLLAMDGRENLYLGRDYVSLDPSEYPMEFEPCTVSEALEWFGRCDEFATDAFGSIAEICVMGAEVMRGERKDKHAKFTERAKAVLTGNKPSLGVISTREAA